MIRKGIGLVFVLACLVAAQNGAQGKEDASNLVEGAGGFVVNGGLAFADGAGAVLSALFAGGTDEAKGAEKGADADPRS